MYMYSTVGCYVHVQYSRLLYTCTCTVGCYVHVQYSRLFYIIHVHIHVHYLTINTVTSSDKAYAAAVNFYDDLGDIALEKG